MGQGLCVARIADCHNVISINTVPRDSWHGVEVSTKWRILRCKDHILLTILYISTDELILFLPDVWWIKLFITPPFSPCRQLRVYSPTASHSLPCILFVIEPPGTNDSAGLSDLWSTDGWRRVLDSTRALRVYRHTMYAKEKCVSSEPGGE